MQQVLLLKYFFLISNSLLATSWLQILNLQNFFPNYGIVNEIFQVLTLRGCVTSFHSFREGKYLNQINWNRHNFLKDRRKNNNEIKRLKWTEVPEMTPWILIDLLWTLLTWDINEQRLSFKKYTLTLCKPQKTHLFI